MKPCHLRSITSSSNNEQCLELWMRLALQVAITCTLLSLLVVNVLIVLSVVIFVGFNKMNLSDKLVLTLIGETLAVVATGFIIVTKFIFPNRAS